MAKGDIVTNTLKVGSSGVKKVQVGSSPVKFIKVVNSSGTSKIVYDTVSSESVSSSGYWVNGVSMGSQILNIPSSGASYNFSATAGHTNTTTQTFYSGGSRTLSPVSVTDSVSWQSSVSWATVSGGTVSVSPNPSSSGRSGTIYAKNASNTSTTTSWSITQKGKIVWNFLFTGPHSTKVEYAQLVYSGGGMTEQANYPGWSEIAFDPGTSFSGIYLSLYSGQSSGNIEIRKSTSRTDTTGTYVTAKYASSSEVDVTIPITSSQFSTSDEQWIVIYSY